MRYNVEEQTRRNIKSAVYIAIILFFVVMMARAIIGSFTLTPQSTQEDLLALPFWQIPLHYIWDYAQHGWLCLGFAFIMSGVFQEFLPQSFILNYMSSNRPRSYLVASILAPIFCVCSCTMVPIFAGLLYAGSGIGPALTFLLVAPANNLLSDIITIQVLGWNIAVADMVAAGISAILIGWIVSKTPWGRAFEKKFQSTQARTANVDLMKQPLDERLWNALTFGFDLSKKILPSFLLGLVMVSYFQAYFPSNIVQAYLTGPTGVLVAALLGGPLYTPTLIEVMVGRALVDLGMSPASTVAWLMGQPYDIPNSMSTAKIIGWKLVITYGVLAFISAVLSGLIYGVLTGGF
jgi:uncharacterized membrane protein YraQ (UPF0718 family)